MKTLKSYHKGTPIEMLKISTLYIYIYIERERERKRKRKREEKLEINPTAWKCIKMEKHKVFRG